MKLFVAAVLATLSLSVQAFAYTRVIDFDKIPLCTGQQDAQIPAEFIGKYNAETAIQVPYNCRNVWIGNELTWVCEYYPDVQHTELIVDETGLKWLAEDQWLVREAIFFEALQASPETVCRTVSFNAKAKVLVTEVKFKLEGWGRGKHTYKIKYDDKRGTFRTKEKLSRRKGILFSINFGGYVDIEKTE